MKKLLLLSAIALCVYALGCPASAQVGDDNNTGIGGFFQGEVTTGCSYNTYTGSATRMITDITVAGTVA